MKRTILVNKEHKINKSFIDKITLVKTKDVEEEDVFLEEETYHAYLELKEFLLQKDIIIGIDSAYRSIAEQQEIYERFVRLYGEDYAKQVVASVGTSEHHTALAIDLGLYKENQFLVDNYELMKYEDVFLEIHSYLSQFGFILRYPKEKEQITGYPYEPWHIRYVGKVVASIIAKNHWTLEEYLNYFSGFLVVNKKKGMTSFDVVREISNIFGIKKVGHTGTLDPLAEGVLVVALGKASKTVELVTSFHKEYIAEVVLGIKTDTLDITGKVLETKEIPSALPIQEVIKSFRTTYLQEVPIYSAVKVNGKKLYDYARNNQDVCLPKKSVTIEEIELLKETEDSFSFRALVTKGCYIRSLIRDICEELGVCGTMSKLTRTKQGEISITMAEDLEEIKKNHYTLYTVEDILSYPVVVVSDDLERKIRNGNILTNQWKINDKVIFKNKENILLGIYEVSEKQLKVWKNFC